MSLPNYSWICQECEHNIIEEIIENVTQYSPILEIELYDDEPVCEYGDITTESYSNPEIRYQCEKCGAEVEKETILEIARGIAKTKANKTMEDI